MARRTDIAFIEEQIAAGRSTIQSINQKYQAYHEEVGAKVREVLEEAGVFEEVKALETEREETRQKAQAKINRINGQLQQLAATQNFLLQREADAPEVSSEETSSEEALEETPAEAPIPEGMDDASEEVEMLPVPAVEDEGEAQDGTDDETPAPGTVITEMELIQAQVSEARKKKKGSSPKPPQF